MKLGRVIVFVLCLVSVALGENPDIKRNVTEMITARGYPVEQHYATTEDGYIMSIQRIPGPRYSSPSGHIGKPVVVLQHGLEDNSITWVISDVPSESLGYILADAGYDVWLFNSRGNTYSNTNTHLSPDTSAFWDFSFDEMAKYDLPTNLNYVLSVTGVQTVSYVGHSQGTIQAFIGFEDPDLQSKVNVFIALAPVAWLAHCKSLLLDAMADLDVDVLFKVLGIKEFTPDTNLLKWLLPETCKVDPSICDDFLGLVMGWDSADLNNTRLPVITAHEPSGTSVVNMVHWAQLIRSKNFQAYDYGTRGNEQHYNSTSPPQYDPSKVNIPVALFYGGQDDLGDVLDVEHIMPLLPNVVYTHEQPEYAHMDFVWGDDAKDEIYPQVVQLIKQYNPSS
eukprot:TRINITY_DN620_c0_g1_i1.p1 TRINITY_DN620_c0_g1~~TRINITY_DN620_c0_g1_i1.p1  ORF type:complete len:393 (+),score=102.53 TRINITY_DN620_c0_g1_i1:38-1216(+)